MRRRGFTLVELMVVVAIIAVLLAILIPAVEAARMMSKLAACSANLKTVASAATLYAFQNRDYYPDRHPNYLRDARHIRSTYAGSEFDLRPKFESFMPLKAFVEPMLGGLAVDDAAIPANYNLLAGFNIYSSWRIDDAYEAMEKIGQRFEALDLRTPGGPYLRRYSVIAGDWDFYSISTWSVSRGSHPDRENPPLLRPRYHTGFDAWDGTKKSWAGWFSPLGSRTRAVDLNFAYSDLSVQRFDRVRGGRTATATDVIDERMDRIVPTNRVPGTRAYDERIGAGAFDDSLYEHLPKQ